MVAFRAGDLVVLVSYIGLLIDYESCRVLARVAALHASFVVIQLKARTIDVFDEAVSWHPKRPSYLKPTAPRR
jgi:hypothetical protein